jgi:hypothetical protein
MLHLSDSVIRVDILLVVLFRHHLLVFILLHLHHLLMLSLSLHLSRGSSFDSICLSKAIKSSITLMRFLLFSELSHSCPWVSSSQLLFFQFFLLFLDVSDKHLGLEFILVDLLVISIIHTSIHQMGILIRLRLSIGFVRGLVHHILHSRIRLDCLVISLFCDRFGLFELL